MFQPEEIDRARRDFIVDLTPQGHQQIAEKDGSPGKELPAFVSVSNIHLYGSRHCGMTVASQGTARGTSRPTSIRT